MEADDVAPAEQLIELDLFDCDIINPQPMAFETEHLAAKGAAGNHSWPVRRARAALQG
jgi:hypothetical protein